jgi:hypothetical protein
LAEQWVKKKVLITVRTYPTPSKKVIEASCTAGICDGKWIRLFPVPYRLLDNDKRFRKYQYIEVDVIKASSDSRPESFKINPDSIKILTEPITTDDKWKIRKSLILPLKNRSLCSLYSERDAMGEPTLGLFKPTKITKFRIQKSHSQWTTAQKESLLQSPLFGNYPDTPLIKLPFDFYYEFQCDEPNCRSHKLSCTDWEIGESYLKWVKEYSDKWEDKFRERYESEMIWKYDTYFYVGTVHDHPSEWVIVGLFYPPKNDAGFQANLFQF